MTMKLLSLEDTRLVSAGFKFHFNVIQVFFTIVGTTIITGPVGGLAIVAAALATQGTGNLVDMYVDEFGRR